MQWHKAFGDTALLIQGYYGDTKYKHCFYTTEPISLEDADLKGIKGLVVEVMLPNLTLRGSYTRSSMFTLRGALLNQLNDGYAAISSGLLTLSGDPALPAAQRITFAQQAARSQRYITRLMLHIIIQAWVLMPILMLGI